VMPCGRVDEPPRKFSDVSPKATATPARGAITREQR
jgi:hypothetical protein